MNRWTIMSEEEVWYSETEFSKEQIMICLAYDPDTERIYVDRILGDHGKERNFLYEHYHDENGKIKARQINFK